MSMKRRRLPQCSRRRLVEFVRECGGPTPPATFVFDDPPSANPRRYELGHALWWLGLIDDGTGEFTDRFWELARAYGTDEWQGSLKRVLVQSYGDALGGMDFDTATVDQLAGRFAEYTGLSHAGAIATAYTFSAYRSECGVRTRTPYRRERSPVRQQAKTHCYPLAANGEAFGSISVPDEMTSEQMAAIRKLVDYMRHLVA